MRPMKERNQITVGIVGTVITGLVVLFAIGFGSLPFINPTNDYHIEFANAAGLQDGDDVRILGIPVGKVDAVEVHGGLVRVDISVEDDIQIGNASSASIEVATVLGNVFVQIESAGSGTLPEDGTIPKERTTVPYSLVTALQSFASFGNGTNTDNLAKSLSTLATTIDGVAPTDAKAALRGLTRIAQTLANKQNRIVTILNASNAIVETLNKNSGSLVQLVVQGDQFLKLVLQRRAIISALLRDTASLGQQLQTLIERNGAHLSSLLKNVKAVTALLAKDRVKLQKAVRILGQFSINIANATGSGPWLDLFAATGVQPDNQIKACGANPNSKNRPCGD